jgi:hypothetical protein
LLLPKWKDVFDSVDEENPKDGFISDAFEAEFETSKFVPYSFLRLNVGSVAGGLDEAF